MKLFLLKIGILFISVFLIGNSIFCQNSKTVHTDSALKIVKPLVNFNSPNGGYYSEYIDQDISALYCGAIVSKQVSSTVENVYLQIQGFSHDDKLQFQNNSDTIIITDSLTNITLSPIEINYYYYIDYLVYNIIRDSVINLSDTIPYPVLYGVDWSLIARSSEPTNTIAINEIDEFQSGDFIGIQLSGRSLYDFIEFRIHCSKNWHESTIIQYKLYHNDSLIIESPIISGESHGDWSSCQFYDCIQFNFDSTYFAGIEITYENDPIFSIGIDTLNYHNFEYESIARIGGKWRSLDFVPVMKLGFNPESIYEKSIVETTVYPNPTTGIINFENRLYEKIEILSLDGKLMQTESNINTNNTDVSSLPQGLYIVRFVAKNKISVAKFYVNK